MTNRVKMRRKLQTETLNVSSHASEILRAASEDEAILAAAGVPQKLGYSDAENLALEVGTLRKEKEEIEYKLHIAQERITDLEAECASLAHENEQASATLDYRLISIAGPVMTTLALSMAPDEAAPMAIQYAQALLNAINGENK